MDQKKLLDLDQLSRRLVIVDTMLMRLVKRRMELAEQVGTFKRHTGRKMFRADVEDSRIEHIKEWARQNGLNPNFAATLLYMLIDESCKLQMIQSQEEALNPVVSQTDDDWYLELRSNLLVLTERWCDAYDSDYEKHAFGTRAYLNFERELIDREIETLVDRDTVIDLGCATGRLTTPLAEHFVQAIGYDVSPHMVAVAKRNAEKHPFGTRTSFEDVDVEVGIPAADASISFVVMNLGTASDVRDIGNVIKETLRVLKVGGKFLFSFYNKDALLYRWEFLPWPVGLVASINLHKNCLEVHSGNEVLAVYARPYTIEEIVTIFGQAGVEIDVRTFPTVSSILPDDLFEQSDIQKAVVTLDANLSTSSMGAYIIVTGQKK